MGKRAAAASNCGGCRLVLQVAVLLGMMAVGIVQVPLAEGFDVSNGLCGTLVQPWGYPCTEYTVQTDDGFLLGVQNIPHGVTQLPSGQARKPVFLQHGLFAGGDNWVFNQPSESLGFILADAGFDVWIGNTRGIDWSHGHITLTPDDADFWDWSWDELAAYDLPTMLGFVYNQTNSPVLYVGHSQGTSILMASLVGTSQAKAMTDKVAGAVLICPIVYMEHITSTFAKVAADLYIDEIANLLGEHEFNPQNEEGVNFIQSICGTTGVNCTDFLQAVGGKHCCLNETRTPFYMNFFPQPTSANSMAHFAQMIRTNTFSKYDYGLLGNMEHYKQSTPPSYELENLPSSVPLMIVQGGQDDLSDPEDVQNLVEVLGTKLTKRFSVDRYGHGDFVYSTTGNVDVYPEIISFLQNPIA